MAIMQTNPGGYNGSSFLLVYNAVQDLIAAGQPELVSGIANLNKAPVSVEEIKKRIGNHLKF